MTAAPTMTAMALHGTGGPNVLGPTQIPVPIPIGDQLLVRVTACGVCGHDLLARRGLLEARDGHVLGHEIAGIVEDVGPDGDAGWIGTRVALVQRLPCGSCEQCLSGHTNMCRSGPGFYGEDLPGGYCELVVATPRNAVALPGSIDDGVGAILSCAVGTGLHALNRAAATPGDVVVITGATGGVGLNAVQLAAHRGCRVVAVTRREELRELVLEAGANEVTLVADGPRAVRDAASRLGSPGGADVVIETTGTPTFELSLRSLRPRGRLAVVGNTTPETVKLALGLIILKELVVTGSKHGDQADLAEVVRLVQQGVVSPAVALWPLAEAAAAHAALEAGDFVGRAVLVP